MLKDAGMDWIIHLDTDELLYPGGAAEYSVRRLLAEVSPDVDMVIFPNYVSKTKPRIKFCTATHMSGFPQIPMTN